MTEKQPSFTVTDRRKFTMEGDVRDESASSQEEVVETASAPPAAEKPDTNVVTMPTPQPPAQAGAEASEDEQQPQPTAQETATTHAAYQQSSRELDTMLRAANPGMPDEGAIGFEHLVQSLSMSAAIGMGAGTEPGQKPRIDILGARQSIDMLAVLQEKTKGNLSAQEQSLLQNSLFELRMMFLEITNAISQSARQQPPPGTGKK